MTFLLDVNVVIALLDPQHVHHDAAHDWFEREGHASWATCPLTENATIRILSQPSYPNPVASPAVAIETLQELCAHEGHTFWPDTISLLDPSIIEKTNVLSHGRITDIYLIALAVSQQGVLATLDRRLVANAVPGGRTATKWLLE